ncbi:endonuclease/exonuclease/phosphatase family protein, partial [Hymenobacter agri]
MLVLTWPHVQRGLALHVATLNEELAMKKPDDKGIPHSSFFIPHSKSVSLLSANVRIFNVYSQLRDPDNASSKNFIRWLAASPADVLCLQEYYNEPGGTRENGGVFQSEARLGRGSGRHAFVSPSLTNRAGAEFGLAIFSRFPIVQRGVIPFGKLTQNHAMWADLARPHDTIRVFNVHFQSMSMAESDLTAATGSRAGLRAKAPNLLRRFRN